MEQWARRVRRLFVETESLAIGRGGQVAVARATGVSRTTIQQGIRNSRAPAGVASRSEGYYPSAWWWPQVDGGAGPHAAR